MEVRLTWLFLKSLLLSLIDAVIGWKPVGRRSPSILSTCFAFLRHPLLLYPCL
jgi:hypothetical protein